MKKLVIALLAGAGLAAAAEAANMKNADGFLTEKQKSIVAISALTANGELEKLKTALNTGLNNGLTVNEIKEVLLQMYAYSGFPRSLNGINTFIAVLKERKTRGIEDPAGEEPKNVTGANKYAKGKETLAKLSGDPTASTQTEFAKFVPAADIFLKEHLFADIFGRGVLSDLDREIATVSALTALKTVNPQLKSHINMSMNVGLTSNQAKEIMAVIKKEVGRKEAANGKKVLNDVLKNKK